MKMKDDFEMDEADDEFGEESEKINPLVAVGIFLGLIIVVGFICALVWSVTHKVVGEPQIDTFETTQEIPETMADEDKEIEAESSEEETVESSIAEEETVEGIENDSIQESEAMMFTEVADTVTAKDVINLRFAPDTSDAENIVAQLLNGETLSRTGINENTGWSRIDYNGQIVYAVSTYLTTDLEYTTPVKQTDSNRITTQDGRVILFTDCDDYVRPKEYVNLRTEPSTSQGESTVKCQISHADIVHRTGYSEDSGWSRVEFYGEVLYVVSSYVYNAGAVE